MQRSYIHTPAMLSAVTVLDGQLTRTWKYPIDGRQHVINLYHDTITGVRSAAVDYEEVRGSMGNSSLMMESTGHTIFFDLPKGTRGHLYINRSGFFGFEYSCFVNERQIREVTDELQNADEPIYDARVTSYINTPAFDPEEVGVCVAYMCASACSSSTNTFPPSKTAITTTTTTTATTTTTTTGRQCGRRYHYLLRGRGLSSRRQAPHDRAPPLQRFRRHEQRNQAEP